MKFLFVSTMGASPWGGSEVLWSQAAMELAELGHEVVVSVQHWPDPAPAIQTLRSLGCSVHERKPNRVMVAVHRRLGRYPVYFRSEKFLKSVKPGN